MNDWLDDALRATPVADDGFADRVIAVGRGQDRTRLILRVLITVISVGAVSALVLGMTLHTLERVGRARGGGIFGEWDDPMAREDAFLADWARLAEQPLFARHRPGPIDERLVEVNARLRTDEVQSRACQREKGSEACDTSFLVGLHNAGGLMLDIDKLEGAWAWSTIARIHLRRAAAVDGATFAAAVDDTSAFGAMLMARFGSSGVLIVIAEEVEAARAAGMDIGGAQAPMSVEDAKRLGKLWWETGAFLGVETKASTRQAIIDSGSLVACGARSDPTGMLTVMHDFTTDPTHHAQLSALLADADGCLAPRPLMLREGFCDEPDGLLCSAYLGILKAPVLREKLTTLMTPLPQSLVKP